MHLQVKKWGNVWRFSVRYHSYQFQGVAKTHSFATTKQKYQLTYFKVLQKAFLFLFTVAKVCCII